MEAWKKRLYDVAYQMLMETGEEYNDICDTLEIPEHKITKIHFDYELRDAIHKQTT